MFIKHLRIAVETFTHLFLLLQVLLHAELRVEPNLLLPTPLTSIPMPATWAFLTLQHPIYQPLLSLPMNLMKFARSGEQQLIWGRR